MADRSDHNVRNKLILQTAEVPEGNLEDHPALNRFLRTLPEGLQAAILRFRREDDRKRKILGLFLLRSCMEDMGFRGDPFDRLLTDENGRPYLGGEGSIDFSLSHSGGFTLCVAIPGGRVGIDVEKIQKVDFDDYRRFIPGEMWREIEEADDRQGLFFKTWTRLEAVAKAHGTGLGAGFEGLRFIEGNAEFGGKTWWLREIHLHPDYSCHLAVDRPWDRIRLLQRQVPLTAPIPHTANRNEKANGAPARL